MRLKDKVMIVTGGAAGLGKSIALRSAGEGADIVVADVDLAGAEAVAHEIENLGRKALAVKLDVRNKEQVESMVDQAVQHLGEIDVLVNNAGIFSHSSFLDLKEEVWDRMLDINLKGSFLCSQAVLRYMVANKIAGSLIHMSSISGLIAFSGSAEYCASKGAILQLSKVLALEFGPYGIRSNAIAPGTFETQMNAWFMDDPEGRQNSLKGIPLGRFGKPGEIADAVVFLASNESAFMSGATLVIDGGQITHV